jgi:hypothetical protein
LGRFSTFPPVMLNVFTSASTGRAIQVDDRLISMIASSPWRVLPVLDLLDLNGVHLFHG